MVTQLVTICLVACEVSTDGIRDLIQGCHVLHMEGTVNTKHRDYSAEDILEELANDGVNVKRAQRNADDGASELTIYFTVPQSERYRVIDWTKNQDGTFTYVHWGVSVGSVVDVDDTKEKWDFRGTVIGFRNEFVQVADMTGDVFDVEPQCIKMAY